MNEIRVRQRDMSWHSGASNFCRLFFNNTLSEIQVALIFLVTLSTWKQFNEFSEWESRMMKTITSVYDGEQQLITFTYWPLWGLEGKGWGCSVDTGSGKQQRLSAFGRKTDQNWFLEEKLIDKTHPLSLPSGAIHLSVYSSDASTSRTTTETKKTFIYPSLDQLGL